MAHSKSESLYTNYYVINVSCLLKIIPYCDEYNITNTQ